MASRKVILGRTEDCWCLNSFRSSHCCCFFVLWQILRSSCSVCWDSLILGLSGLCFVYSLLLWWASWGLKEDSKFASLFINLSRCFPHSNFILKFFKQLMGLKKSKADLHCYLLLCFSWEWIRKVLFNIQGNPCSNPKVKYTTIKLSRVCKIFERSFWKKSCMRTKAEFIWSKIQYKH